jgi:serine O-acetyltransferase
MRINKNPKVVPHKKWGAEQLYYWSHWLWRRGNKKLAYGLKYLNVMIFRNFIPPEVQIGHRLDLPHGGFGVVIQRDTVIGDDAVILHGVTIADGGVRIGHRVYIGTGAVIVGPSVIGDDVRIGANTVVNFDVPAGATVVGGKGRIILRAIKETAES